MKIAIIGAGISGLGAAYLLAPHHDITLYEKNDYIGGHSRTIDVGAQPVDTGFIVFNNWNYPNLLGLFKELDVPFEKSDMSFGASIKNGWLEYGSYDLFAQKSNLLRLQFWGMLFDVLRFNKKALSVIEKSPDISLQECLDHLNLGSWFRQYYLLAMGAAIWSCPVKTIMDFPAKTFLQFFKNHGLLSVNNRPQWYTVTGGSRQYVGRIKNNLSKKITFESGAKNITKDGEGYIVRGLKNNTQRFDNIIFACHADEALAMIDAPNKDEKEVLGAFQYQSNKVITHSDDSFMPRNKKCWASWVYLSENRSDESDHVSLSYWMNNLQNFETEKPLLVTLNPSRRPDENLIHDEHEFSHPIFDMGAIKAQERIQDIQGKRGLWFCGAYQRYGFHEDGLLSAVNVVKAMGYDIPWEK